MRCKVGDKVRVRQWDDMAKESGLNDCGDINNGFTQSMKHFVEGFMKFTKYITIIIF